MVHVDELFKRMQSFQTTCARAIANREYSAIDEARDAFRLWCERNNLPIDFTDPNKE